ncbi:PREDICTED: uncharacterized protein K02A2.6-like [Amphimedon queenslandica]|uniref:Integrase catalytic domain-containing protein n=1 Tax=Amphimedon queenslandica TaxID=400682 RepID=A0A1X7UJ49_AMPQE|nr:PREDICTED: uncharacterized protein K02A2.6-like [Amphimedon queenslandica]|eukprot:XP_011404918.1 PREDICTED: uncharacterized protein K02A2.6-like [Amphimedon queenslandica]
MGILGNHTTTVNRMKVLAESYVWWPGLDTDIATNVQHGHHCQENRNSPAKAPLHPWEWPTQPWTRLHMDHAGPYQGKLFLVLVDSHSKWLEVCIVPSTSAEATIKVFKSIFSTHGIPEQIVTDNGTGFESGEFQDFMSQMGIQHICTSPYHPSSNGLAERAVKTFKSTVSKLDGLMEHCLTQFRFKYRVTSQTTTNLSAVQLLIGRRLRTIMDLLHPDASKRVEDKQRKLMTDKRPRTFAVGDKVFVRDVLHKKWIPAVVIKITGPLSYHVETNSGVVLRMHVDHLCPHFPEDMTTSTGQSEGLGPTTTIIPTTT